MAKTAKKQEESTESVAVPSIEIAGHINKFISYLESEQPELISVGYARLPGTNDYVSYTVTSKGNQITKIVCEEPNLKVIAEESAKISFVNNFVDEE